MISAKNMMRQPPEKVQWLSMYENSVNCPEGMRSDAALFLLFQLLKNRRTQLRHAARAEGKDHVARLCRR